MGCVTCRSSCDDCSDNGLSFRARLSPAQRSAAAPKVIADTVENAAPVLAASRLDALQSVGATRAALTEDAP